MHKLENSMFKIGKFGYATVVIIQINVYSMLSDSMSEGLL